jgi:porin
MVLRVLTVLAVPPLTVFVACAGVARAQDVPQSSSPTTPDAAGSAAAGTLLGGMFGLRPALATVGATLGVSETSDFLADPVGGSRRQASYQGLTVATLQVATAQALGLAGGTFNISAEQIHGRNLVSDALDDLHSNSSVDSIRGTRLWEFWYQQSFGPAADVRVGQQSIDQEYMISSTSAMFLNANFGWPLLPSNDLPSGGPIYPLSALGVRLHVTPMHGVSVLAGVYNGSPVERSCSIAPPLCDPTGASFPLDGGALGIAEVQVTPAFPTRPGTYKLGAWIDTDSLPVTRFAQTPVTRGRGSDDWSVYAVMDQTVRQGPKGLRAVDFFARAFTAPSDRNLIDMELATGLVLKAPTADRSGDSVGIGVDYGRIGRGVRMLDEAAEAAGQLHFARTEETVVEASYQASVRPWLLMQPDVQYVFNPGGGIADPRARTERLRDELVLGVRANVTF